MTAESAAIDPGATQLLIRGNASPEDVAILLALLAGNGERPLERGPLARWRQTRQRALARTAARKAG